MTDLDTHPIADRTAIEERGPLAPPAMVAVVDRLLRTRPATVVALREETPTIVSPRPPAAARVRLPRRAVRPASARHPLRP